jgi:hypothetical protein
MPVTGFFGSTFYGPPAQSTPEPPPSGDPGVYFAEQYFVDEYWTGEYWPNISGFEPSSRGPDPSRTIAVTAAGSVDPARSTITEF